MKEMSFKVYAGVLKAGLAQVVVALMGAAEAQLRRVWLGAAAITPPPKGVVVLSERVLVLRAVQARTMMMAANVRLQILPSDPANIRLILAGCSRG